MSLYLYTQIVLSARDRRTRFPTDGLGVVEGLAFDVSGLAEASGGRLRAQNRDQLTLKHELSFITDRTLEAHCCGVEISDGLSPPRFCSAIPLHCAAYTTFYFAIVIGIPTFSTRPMVV